MTQKKIAVIGLGYIGLPTAAVLASRKLDVQGVDINQQVVDTINRGEVHIVEPDLDMVVKAAVNQGFLTASTEPAAADIFLIAVPTPLTTEKAPDTSHIRAAAESIAPVLSPGNLVILESTSPIGTTECLSGWLAELRPDLLLPHEHGEQANIRVAHCPERVLPGKVLRELVQNDRIVGGITSQCSAAAVDLYREFVEAQCLVTDVRTAEMCKLTENSFRDLNIAFANELSLICDQFGVDVWRLIELANHHPRVDILTPGPGVGGHCIAVDPWFLAAQSPEKSRLIRTAREVNDEKPSFTADRIAELTRARGARRVICLGATFKADIDDLRESPSLEIIRQLRASGLEVLVVEPNVQDLSSHSPAPHTTSLNEALDQAEDAVIAVLVAHREFRESSRLRGLQPYDVCGALAISAD